MHYNINQYIYISYDYTYLTDFLANLDCGFCFGFALGIFYFYKFINNKISLDEIIYRLLLFIHIFLVVFI